MEVEVKKEKKEERASSSPNCLRQPLFEFRVRSKRNVAVMVHSERRDFCGCGDGVAVWTWVWFGFTEPPSDLNMRFVYNARIRPFHDNALV